MAACLASSSGEANGWLTTATPSLIDEVAAARYPSETIGSSTDRYTGARAADAGASSRWNVHSDRYPSRSARRASSVRFRGVAHAPDTGAPNPISMV